MTMLHSALPNTSAYVEHFSQQSLPILRYSVRELDALRAQEIRPDAPTLVALAMKDPLLAMRLLIRVESRRDATRTRDITTIERAVMMLGVEPCMAMFEDALTVENVLQAYPHALVGVLRVIARARRTAELARGIAVMRRDLDVAEITAAALLNDATDIVCWVYAPTLTARVYGLQKADRSLRSSIAQRAVFHVTAAQIQSGLVRAWGLPELLIRLLDDNPNHDPRVRTIELAARIARHSARGWDDAGLPDDFTELAALLRCDRSLLLQRLHVPEAFHAALGGSARG